MLTTSYTTKISFRRPEATVRALFECIGITFANEMLTSGSFGQNSSFSDVQHQGISQSPLGRYVQELAPVDIAICNAMGGQMMRRHGYVRAEVPICKKAWTQAWTRIAMRFPMLRKKQFVHQMAVGMGVRDRASDWIKKNARKIDGPPKQP